jgi:hypothetical protein
MNRNTTLVLGGMFLGYLWVSSKRNAKQKKFSAGKNKFGLPYTPFNTVNPLPGVKPGHVYANQASRTSNYGGTNIYNDAAREATIQSELMNNVPGFEFAADFNAPLSSFTAATPQMQNTRVNEGGAGFNVHDSASYSSDVTGLNMDKGTLTQVSSTQAGQETNFLNLKKGQYAVDNGNIYDYTPAKRPEKIQKEMHGLAPHEDNMRLSVSENTKSANVNVQSNAAGNIQQTYEHYHGIQQQNRSQHQGPSQGVIPEAPVRTEPIANVTNKEQTQIYKNAVIDSAPVHEQRPLHDNTPTEPRVVYETANDYYLSGADINIKPFSRKAGSNNSVVPEGLAGKG